MLQHLKDVSNQSNTTNGDHAYDSTLNSVLDLFGKGGAMRHDENEFVRLLDNAYSDTPDLALKTLFYLRDIRGGQGEPDVFRAGLLHLANVKGAQMEHLIPMVPVYGRFDDLFVLLDTPLEKCMMEFILKHMQFNQSVRNGNVRVIDSCKEAFESAGYPFPEIIFWNVAGHSTVSVTKNEQGVALVSGASPSTLKAILASKDLSPERLMLDVLLSERYNNISA